MFVKNREHKANIQSSLIFHFQNMAMKTSIGARPDWFSEKIPKIMATPKLRRWAATSLFISLHILLDVQRFNNPSKLFFVFPIP